MAKAKEKEKAGNESVQSILGKIRKVVSGKEKIVIEDDTPQAEPISSFDDEEPMELTEVVENVEETPSQNIVTEEALIVDAEASVEAEDDDSFVDILQEIDKTLEQQYKDSQEAQAAEPVVIAPEIPGNDVLPDPEPEAVIEEVIIQPVNANVAQEVTQNEAVAPVQIKKEFPEAVSANIVEPTGFNKAGREMAENKPNILSEDIANKSSKAIQNLLNNIPRPQIDSPAFRSATTLEDLTMEMIKPMLKEWLDQNLETIVRDIVQKEIRKIIPHE